MGPYTLAQMNRLSGKKRFSVVSTFAGGGGSSIGYRLAGGDVILANEISQVASETYSKNHPVPQPKSNSFPLSLNFFSKLLSLLSRKTVIILGRSFGFLMYVFFPLRKKVAKIKKSGHSKKK